MFDYEIKRLEEILDLKQKSQISISTLNFGGAEVNPIYSDNKSSTFENVLNTLSGNPDELRNLSQLKGRYLDDYIALKNNTYQTYGKEITDIYFCVNPNIYCRERNLDLGHLEYSSITKEVDLKFLELQLHFERQLKQVLGENFDPIFDRPYLLHFPNLK